MYLDCMYVYMYVFVPSVCLVPMKFRSSPKTGVTESCETPCRHWKSSQDPLPTELLTTESIFKPCELVLVSDSLRYLTEFVTGGCCLPLYTLSWLVKFPKWALALSYVAIWCILHVWDFSDLKNHSQWYSFLIMGRHHILETRFVTFRNVYCVLLEWRNWTVTTFNFNKFQLKQHYAATAQC